jgi:hypothetical protein
MLLFATKSHEDPRIASSEETIVGGDFAIQPLCQSLRCVSLTKSMCCGLQAA